MLLAIVGRINLTYGIAAIALSCEDAITIIQDRGAQAERFQHTSTS